MNSLWVLNRPTRFIKSKPVLTSYFRAVAERRFQFINVSREANVEIFPVKNLNFEIVEQKNELYLLQLLDLPAFGKLQNMGVRGLAEN